MGESRYFVEGHGSLPADEVEEFAHLLEDIRGSGEDALNRVDEVLSKFYRYSPGYSPEAEAKGNLDSGEA